MLLLDLRLDRRSRDKSLQLALYEALRDAVLGGRLGPGARLPATRDLARELRIARGTVVAAYDQLTGEGYLRGDRGAGTFVVDALPDAWFAPKQGTRRAATASPPPRTPRLAVRAKALSRSPFPTDMLVAARPFRPHTPSVDAFPRARWGRLVAKHARKTNVNLYRDVDAHGYRPLRAALAEHLRVSRGVKCTTDRIIIVPSVHLALDLAARLLLDPGDEAWLEDPGYFGARRVLEASGVALVPVPVDDAGLDIDAGMTAAPHARLAYVTPAHQAPIGSTLSLERRMRLLDFAARSGMWIFEDDYDSEFRYEGRPLPALQGLDEHGVVLHAGTFGKSLFPGLRVGYLVLPEALVDPFAAAMSTLHRFVPLLSQAALTDFIVEGDLGRHLRRMRLLYSERREALLGALETELGDELAIVGQSSGLAVLAMLEPGVSDRAVARLAFEAGIEMFPLSKYAMRPLRRGGLLLGFAAVSAARSVAAVSTLRKIIVAAR